MSDHPLVLVEHEPGVMIVTFNRPDRLNAWTNSLEDEYFAALDAAEDDPDVRCVVVTGAGRGFCAGADMENLKDTGGARARSVRPRSRTHPMTLEKPLIAAINGPAAGLGLVEALFCDIRFCTPEAKLTAAFPRRGLIAEYGVSWILPRLVGMSRALDLLLSGRVILGEEALRIGLVDHLAPRDELRDRAVAYARELASFCAPTSMRVIKHQVRRHLDTDLATAIAESDALMLGSFGTPDAKEGVESYVERRPPAFAPLPPRAERPTLPG